MTKISTDHLVKKKGRFICMPCWQVFGSQDELEEHQRECPLYREWKNLE